MNGVFIYIAVTHPPTLEPSYTNGVER
jgi:hypothetical protein